MSTNGLHRRLAALEALYVRPAASAAPPVLPVEAAMALGLVARLFGAERDAPGVAARFWATLGYTVDADDPADRALALAEAAPYTDAWIAYLIKLNAQISNLDAAALRSGGRYVAGMGGA
jgi:hypothetical protein